MAEENARLKADIKDLRKDRIRMCDVTIEDIAVIARLKSDVERLRKAGDVLLLALWLGVDEYSKLEKEKAEELWNAAKEGKPNA